MPRLGIQTSVAQISINKYTSFKVQQQKNSHSIKHTGVCGVQKAEATTENASLLNL